MALLGRGERATSIAERLDTLVAREILVRPTDSRFSTEDMRGSCCRSTRLVRAGTPDRRLHVPHEGAMPADAGRLYQRQSTRPS